MENLSYGAWEFGIYALLIQPVFVNLIISDFVYPFLRRLFADAKALESGAKSVAGLGI